MTIAESTTQPDIQQTLAVINALHHCDPLSASQRRTRLEHIAGLWSRRLLVMAGACQAIPWGAWLFMNASSLSDSGKGVMLVCVLLSLVLTMASFLAPIIVAGWTLIRWKKVNFEDLKAEILHEHAHAERLAMHNPIALQDAQVWLELKIKRLEGRIALFFGDKTAILGLLATAYLFIKEFGGFPWLGKTVQAGFAVENSGDLILFMLAALVFGISLGAMFMKQIAARYRYQVELIELACR